MILKRRPWTVHDDLFSIEPYKPEWRTVDFSFTSMVIWVRVFQLPLRAMNGTVGLQLGGIIATAIGVDHRVEGGNLGEFLRIRLQYGSWLRVSVQKPTVGPRRKQGIEYFATNGEAAEYAGAPADTTPPPAGSSPSAGSNNAGNDDGIPKTTEAVVGEPSGTVSGFSNAGSDTPATVTKGMAPDKVSPVADAAATLIEEEVPAAAKATEEEMPAVVNDKNYISAGVGAAIGSIEAAPTGTLNRNTSFQVPPPSAQIVAALHAPTGTHAAQPDGVLKTAVSTEMRPAIAATEDHQVTSTEIGTVATPQHGVTKGREGGVIRASKRCLQGIGVVARDSSGQVLCGLARHLDNLSEAEFAEHAALLAGLHLVLDRGWTRVQIEMDSAQTVNRLCRPS
ncbi:hypothetical protein V6N12_013791 [Hibiscus sabdariffa]|uniref:RNase H type-1 domain-containing protein n=1 Tax=Hibiscus sabdariffa TaxID=183260 RepID=A0ABR2CV95_9ROSI